MPELERSRNLTTTSKPPHQPRVRVPKKSWTHQEEGPEEPQIPDAHNEPEATTEQDTTAMRAQMEQVLQNPQQCAELMQLCIARTEVLTLLPADLRLRIAPVPPMEEEVETRSDHSMASGLPLQMRAPTEAPPSSTDMVHWPVPQLFGLIRASMDQLEQRLQEAERSIEIARKEQFVVHTYRMQEAHDKLQVQCKLEKVQEKLVEAWRRFGRLRLNYLRPAT
jgi:hypothetical protein